MTSLITIKEKLISKVGKPGVKMTQDQFCQRVFNLYGNEYLVLGTYTKSSVKIKIQHTIFNCNHEWETLPSNFLRGHGCPKCGAVKEGLDQRITNSEFLIRVNSKFGEEYDILDNYETCHKKIRIRHKVCKCIFSRTPNTFIRGKGCPKCNCLQVKGKDTNFYKEEVFDLVGNEYEVLGEYTRGRDKISMKHISCGHIWDVEASSFLMGNRCPHCQKSKGEKAIRRYLLSKNILFKEQFKFDDCRGIVRPLPFDFAICDINDCMISLIEYDGEQHYKAMRFTNSDNAKSLEIIQARDKNKTDYCILNNIPLLRIPYWDLKNIDKILDREMLQQEEVDNHGIAI